MVQAVPDPVASLSQHPLFAVVAVAALLAGWLAVARLRRRIDGGTGARVLTLALMSAYVLFAGGVAVALLVAWGLDDPVRRALADSLTQAAALRMAVTVGALAGAYLLVGATRRAVDEFVAMGEVLSVHEGEVLFRLSQVTVYGVALLGLLGVWEVDLTNFLISAGVLGVVLGLAAQQTLGAVISGFVIMLSRPFAVGDFVRIGDREGVVTDVSPFDTRLRTVDREHVSVPNDVVEAGEIVNYSRGGGLRVHVSVDVDYDADLDRAVDAALEAVSTVALAAEEPDYDVRFGESAMELDLAFVVRDPTAERRWRARRDAVAAIKAAFEEAGVKIPYPQRELAGRKERGGFHVRSEPVER